MVASGIDVIETRRQQFINMRLAMVTNNVAATTGGISSRLHLLRSGFNIVKLFSPEHGLTAMGIDGAAQPDIPDILTELPVKSLYGVHMEPSENQLQDVDGVLFDIPDVGCRFYTYLWTMTYVMEACARYNKKFVVLDRPNPIGGDLSYAEGPMLDELHCSSFIGRWSIPVRHSCTMGELATFFAGTRVRDLDLMIIKVQNWNRLQDADEAGWKFVPTSPAIPGLETAFIYPGMGLLEGINVNEGRGTTHAFAVTGAPWIDPQLLLKHWQDLSLPGVKAETIRYVPVDSTYKDEMCNGLRLSITDKRSFKPVHSAISLIRLLMRLFPADITKRKYRTAANPSGDAHLDKLLGVKNAFDKLQTGEPVDTTGISDEWQKLVSPYLLY